MTKPTAFCADRIFDGNRFTGKAALLVDGDTVTGIVKQDSIPSHYAQHANKAPMIVPGFVDLQVNGGGGALLNETPTQEGIATICEAHARFGTTALMPTLITDGPDVRDRALEAGKQAAKAKTAGFLGLHLEGPHLSVPRKGVHVADFIRPMEEQDLSVLLAAQGTFGKSMITIAPENVTIDQVKALVEAGWHVSLGHTDCDAETAFAYFEAGASMATHLFNAMSQMRNREPGLVGAVLTTDKAYCGMIADGYHIANANMRVALHAKQGPGRIFFVTDAMSPTGTDVTEFILSGRQTFRRDGRLALADGTLAGADIDMISMVRKALATLPLSLEEALKMASRYPSEAIGAQSKGRLKPGSDADFLLLDETLCLQSTWIGGTCAHSNNNNN
ncbi:N-acetylglucosamine-6-phosphate deacetylase [Cohaesibacter marisflavi]|uniref:N-acetylglucosamine-6-phosphate deacetylase n=1 Tax=Cohaesibacter marisflavi TaxID=655353 RepID=A0A1I5L9G8_9HYPH|nr:N-acetylglucosamine-6-phosphate deacetylase [Cohaesibacter marisflavi]SFO93897.1 N-acetylglucosamine-6-phosphate deacetylase [Cohaesibacter marisflavi]